MKDLPKNHNDLKYSIKKGDLWISISMLLDQADYEAWWAGENGSDGSETDQVSKIRDILLPFAKESGIDLQIWEEGNAFAQNLKPESLHQIKAALEAEFNGDFELSEIQ